MDLSCEAMADWIFQGNPRHYDLDASVAASRRRWWGTPRYRDRMSVGDRVWLQVVGPKDPGVYYVATIVSQTYEHPVQPSDPAHFRWRTDIRFDYRIRPPLLRSELVEDVQLGSFRPFRGFEGSNVPVPPEVAAALAARAAPRASSPCDARTGGAPLPADSAFRTALALEHQSRCVTIADRGHGSRSAQLIWRQSRSVDVAVRSAPERVICARPAARCS